MDNEQLKNSFNWLDEERRKDKAILLDLQKKLAKLEGTQDKTQVSVKESVSEIDRMKVLIAKIDKFDSDVSLQASELKKELDALEKRAKRRERDGKTATAKEMEKLSLQLAEVAAKLKSEERLKEELAQKKENEHRFNRLFAETEQMINDFKDKEAIRNQSLKSLESERSKDIKRIADIQGELALIRKRTDEQQARIELGLESQKKIEDKVGEMLRLENERAENNRKFLETVKLDQTDKERLWKEWNQRFEKIEGQTKQLDKFLLDFSESELAVRRAQEAFNSITEQISRRIHEITEVQRLGEEKFRQEWSSFKLEDQKRWANYQIAQDEQFKENKKHLEKITKDLAGLNDNYQSIDETIQHVNEQTDAFMQTLHQSLREWLLESERVKKSSR